VLDTPAPEPAPPDAAVPSAPAPLPAPGWPRAARPGAVAGTLAGIAAVLVLSAVALALALALRPAGNGLDPGASAALFAARQEVVNFTSFDYRHLAADFAQVATDATGPFAHDFASQESNLRQRFTTTRAVSRGTILEAGVATFAASAATVVVAVDDVVTNASTPAGSTLRYRLQVSLVRLHGRWVVSDVRPIA